ncbi:MAG: YgiQ family radical SAM protein [archaeon]
MIAKSGTGFDIIIITAEKYEDHPFSPAGVIARVLDAKGYNIGIIELPKNKEDFTGLGKPKLFFGVTAGSIDSMLNNYTPLKKKRIEDKFNVTDSMPDRAVVFYCNKIREFFKESKIIIGGIESSLRRFTHYDYWDNDLRRSILFDSRADILIYGNAELQIIELAERIKNNLSINGVKGTCIISDILPDGFTLLPSHEDSKSDKLAFCKMQIMLSNRINLAQKTANKYVLQYESPAYSSKDLDWIYSLNYSRNLSKGSLLKMAQFSVVTHRGCIGNCSFCSIALHQGDKIISRSEESILAEIKKITKHPDFKGYIDDLGGPSANMYGMDCEINCMNECIKCNKLNKSHARIISLMKKARAISGIKKIFVRSGIRYDLVVESRKYIEEISKHHISGTLKIAPEHFSEKVTKLMNKDNSRFDEFSRLFNSINKEKKQFLKYYFMVGHPGESFAELKILKEKIKDLNFIESVQLFTPTPMSDSTCMYWTEINPKTMQKVDVIYDYNTKKKVKNYLSERKF